MTAPTSSRRTPAGQLAAVLPLSDRLFDDDTIPATTARLLIQLALVIPVRTVLLEELAFRGVLWGLIERRLGSRNATVWSSAAFGLWHVPAGLRLLHTNGALAAAAEDAPLIGAAIVIAIVLATGCVGALLCELRRRSGSLLAPAGLHWAVNSVATVLSAAR